MENGTHVWACGPDYGCPAAHTSVSSVVPAEFRGPDVRAWAGNALQLVQTRVKTQEAQQVVLPLEGKWAVPTTRLPSEAASVYLISRTQPGSVRTGTKPNSNKSFLESWSRPCAASLVWCTILHASHERFPQ